MGASLSSTIGLGLSYCFCTAAGSLCNSCFGSTAEGTTGRKRSVLLLSIAIVVAFWFQYTVGPGIVSQEGWIWTTYRMIPGMGKLVYNSWSESCRQAYNNNNGDGDNGKDKNVALIEQCAGNAGVYRPMALATMFFLCSAIATKVQPSLNKEAWPAKYTIFAFAVFFSVFFPNDPLFSGVYLWLARAGATVFVLLEQVILIDVAYNWNEDWIDRADQADRLVYGSGNAWLKAVVATCAGFYIATLTGISLLYKYFGDCSENTWIITLTLLGIIALTGIQLAGSADGSLLTSSIISLYVTYLAYSMVSKNPNGQCNPQLGSNDVTGIVIGLTLTAVSLAWTGWSWTAEGRLNVDGVQSAKSVTQGAGNNRSTADGGVNLDVPFLDPGDAPTSGLVMDSSTGDVDSPNYRGEKGADVWKLNIVLALICCWVAMTLTGWGTIYEDIDESSNRHAANPTIGRFNMAMIGVSQWCAILLYVWTLVAPRMFPDYDFS